MVKASLTKEFICSSKMTNKEKYVYQTLLFMPYQYTDSDRNMVAVDGCNGAT